jgi:hypothetical protein
MHITAINLELKLKTNQSQAMAKRKTCKACKRSKQTE